MTEQVPTAILEPRLVGDISDNFFIPSYQRGYRWGHAEVLKLLDDIWASRDEPYYLQPIVVLERGDEMELVDGQQRLTTLFLVLQYMKNEGWNKTGATFSLRYETRPDSADYLVHPDEDRSQLNIDFFHIHAAYRAIHHWFANRGDDIETVAMELRIALFRQVKVIWYLASRDQVDATTLFTRLNVGRIPLTDAELVKALLLSQMRKPTATSDRSQETAIEWDAIERDLRDPERWAFITGKGGSEATHIGILLDTLADQVSDEVREKTGSTAEERKPLRGRDRPQFHTFDTLRTQIVSDPLSFWGQVVDLHSLVMDWHDNHHLFHKIGYLVAEKATTLASLSDMAAGKPKSTFQRALDEMIRGHLGLTESALRELTYGRAESSRALFLMNVETIREREISKERYSFKEHASGRWSLEHVHAQNAQQLPRSTDVWESWLRMARRAVAGISEVQGGRYSELIGRVDQVLENLPVRGADFDALERELTSVLSEGSRLDAIDVDSIANLALLDAGDNSALGNSPFAVKRNEILDRDREGSYIPVCTRNVFLKYYSPGAEHQAHFWSIDDRTYYLDKMADVLRPYFLHGGETE